MKTHEKIALISRQYRKIRNEYDPILELNSLTLAKFEILGRIKKQTFIELANEMDVAASFLTVMLRDLKKQGFVKITGSKEDGRAKIVELTDQGRKVIDSLSGYSVQYDEDCFSNKNKMCNVRHGNY